MSILTPKKCPNCGKQFTPKFDNRQKYCDSYKGGSNTCKTYASRKRNGKMEENKLIPQEPQPRKINQRKIDTINKKIKTLKAELKPLKSRAAKILSWMKDENNNKERIEELELLNNLTSIHLQQNTYYDPFIVKWARDDMKKRNEEIKDLKEKRGEFEREIYTIDKKYRKKRLALFRLIEEKNDLNKQYFNPLLPISVSMHKSMLEHTTFYPFSEISLHDKDFDSWGKLPQPFLIFFRKKELPTFTQKIFLICSSLVSCFEMKILYLGSILEINNDFRNKVNSYFNSSLFSYKVINSKLEITQLLLLDEYECLILHGINNWKGVNHNFLYELQRQYPKLSLMVIAKRENANIETIANIVYDGENIVKKATTF